MYKVRHLRGQVSGKCYPEGRSVPDGHRYMVSPVCAVSLSVPAKARRNNKMMLTAAAMKLKKDCEKRKKNQLFL